MAGFQYYDYDDGCHNLVVTCGDRDEMVRLKEWCRTQVGPDRCGPIRSSGTTPR